MPKSFPLGVTRLSCTYLPGKSCSNVVVLERPSEITRDVDLVLLSKEIGYHDKKRVLYSLASLLKRAGITKHVTVIAKAKVPIVKFDTIIGKTPLYTWRPVTKRTLNR